ncbi:sulfurtransferase [Methylogaea oryzae]|nr:sulfurtransferase [Methylogaea oryzae]
MERNTPLVVVDTRAPEEYVAEHLPGAVNIRDIFSYLATTSEQGVAALRDHFADLFGKAGIGGDEDVVIYEDTMNSGYGQSCRGWFLLRYLGHERVRVLDGGLRAWKAEGRSVTDAPSAPVAVQFKPRPAEDAMVTCRQMLDSLSDAAIVKLDTRDYDEWTGESSSPYGRDFAPRKGRIPGAVWIEWHRLMDVSSGIPRFRPKEEVRAICREVGVTPESTVYLYCFKGARAANTLLALTEAGFGKVGLYFGSWNEWSRDPALPIEAGEPDPARMASRASA